MSLGKDTFCRGVDIYNLSDTGDICASVTTCVGQSTATGPKVAVSKNRPFPVRIDSAGNGVCGTIDAHIYCKNNRQDNSKYIIEKKGKGRMTMEDAIKEINKDAPHQQDQLNYDKDAARSLAAGTHGAASHLTKTVCEDDEQCVVRRLTTTETARLQGFPDDYTKINGNGTSDAPQYKAHGNSWATPCAFFMSSRMELEMRRLGVEGAIRYATCCSGIEAHSTAVKNLDWKSVFFSEIEPFPCDVLKHHYPNTPNLGDMTQIHYDANNGVITNSHKDGETYDLPSCFRRAEIQQIPYKVGDLHVFSGGTPCFTKGTMVLTRYGYKPIEEIEVGEEVLTHLGRFRKVVRIGNKKSKDLVAVSFVGRSKIVCTADHPFPMMTPHRHKSGEYYFDSPILTEIKNGEGKFVQMVDARVNDFGVKIPKLPKVYNASAKEIFELCGWYVGDGYIRGWTGKGKKAIMLCLNGDKTETFEKRFNGKINYTVCKSEGIFKIQICCTEFARFLHDNFGELAGSKKIPVWAYRKDVSSEFLHGYLMTDGCRLQDGCIIQWSTISPSLAFGIADMVGKTCVNKGNMPKTTTSEGRIVNQHDFYTVRHNDAANHFHKEGSFDCIKIRKVEHLVGKTDTVYNIEVEEDHTYVVNGIVTHNCQDISVAGKRKGMAEDSGSRSSLAFHYQRIIDEMQPMMTLWENVPGAFSSNGGKDFIWFVNKCAESGYTMAWRVIDAQYTTTEEFPRAVPQRRRRIWLVGYHGKDWRVPARVVFELKKDLTDEPPIRIPGKGFTTLNPDFDENDVEIRVTSRKKSKKDEGQGLFAFDVVETNDNKLKVSHLIDFEDMPSESNFALLSQTDIYNFIRKVGEPCYIGPVFRSDSKKKKAKKRVELDLFATAPQVEDTVDEVAGDESSEWEGAEKISPDILANIGNSGILSNGMIATINCHEWTSGIQLSPTKYNIYNEFAKNLEWLKANDLLPKAYDGTVCGLSDVLEENPDEKYNLSWRACFGILKRAAGRGKELPPALEIALIATIREKAGIVKWIAVNGKDTKKKESDLSERESARLCFDEYISSVMNFDDVAAVEPKKRNGDDEGEDDEVADDFDDEGNPIENEEDFGVNGNPTISADGDVIEASGNDGDSDKSSQVVKGVDTKLDASRVEDEVSPTLLATSYKEPPAVIK